MWIKRLFCIDKSLRGTAVLFDIFEFAFTKMKTAMALFTNQEKARSIGLLE